MSYKGTKSVGKVLAWIGKYGILVFIISMILLAVTISNADPQSHAFQGDGDIRTINFSIDSTKDVAFIFGVDGSYDNTTFELYKLEDVGTQSNQTQQTLVLISDDIGVSQEVDVLELSPGDYQIQVYVDEGQDAWVFYFYVQLGLIVSTAMMIALFGIMLAAFVVICQIFVFVFLVELVLTMTSDAGSSGRTYQSSSPTSKYEGQSTFDYRHASDQTSGVRPSTTPGFAKNVPFFENLTKKDWVWVLLAAFFFLIYLSDPFDNGPSFFFVLLFAAVVFYNVTEREKTKDRMGHLLNAYPKVTLAFASEQLDKSEDHIIEVLRIMILDEGAPIRLDLINRTITKVDLRGEPAKPQPVVSSTQSSQNEVSETVEEEAETDDVEENSSEQSGTSNGSTIVHGSQGEVRQPWAFCQACGEGLKQKVKYCYSCGARQYD